MATESHTTIDGMETEAFLEFLLESVRGTFVIYSVYLGDRLGYYSALAEGKKTAGELAAATGTDERYTREWLEQQTVAGILTVENPDASASERRFVLPASYVEVLCEPDSLHYLAPLAQVTVGALSPIHEVVEAYRTGAGVPFEAFGEDLHEGQGAINRPAFLHQLGQEWLPSLSDVDERLRAGGQVADVGCGHGWSSIGIARSYPDATVDGYDMDAASIERARQHAVEYDVDDRVTFHLGDAATVDRSRRYELVTAFECVHDMSDPVAVLRTMRDLAGEDGTVLIMDERVGESFSPTADEVEEIMYGWSIFHCLPVGRIDDGVGTGTVMRERTLQTYAEEAGFSTVSALPIENYFFRFYRLTP